jgi:hypothetical protein
MLALASNAVVSFSAAPLQAASRIGLAVVGAGCVYFAYIIIRYLFWHDLERGWGSIVCTLLILGGLQLFFIGLIGEYLARVFEEVKRRPLYLLKQKPKRRGRRREQALEATVTTGAELRRASSRRVGAIEGVVTAAVPPPPVEPEPAAHQ